MFKSQKIYFFILLIVLVVLPLFFVQIVQANALTITDAYKAIVKIYTYAEDESYILSPVQTGSGIIIDNQGLIITNSHVVTVEDDFGDEAPSAYMICLTTSTTEEPECRFSAELVSKDESQDIAILQIKNIDSLSTEENFGYLEFADTSEIEEGDEVKALGYPGIGGDTITTTSGTVSGTVTKYSSSWIKTDTSFSFGSSGGALVNDQGDLVGITTRAHSDLLGSLGYVIDINSIKGWIEENKDNEIEESELQDRLESFVQKKFNLKSTNIYSNSIPSISITKNSSWGYEYEGEGSIAIENPESSDGGGIYINWEKISVEAEMMLDHTIELLNFIGSYIYEGEIEFSGKTGRKLVNTMFGEEIHQILLPSKNYLIIITYYYGEDNIDKDAIDEMLDNISIDDSGNDFAEKRYFEYSDPYFRINLTDEWALRERNSASTPVAGQNTEKSGLSFSIDIEELTESIKGADNEEYFNYIKSIELTGLDPEFEYLFGLNGERYFTSTDYKLNDELNNVIFYKYEYTNNEEEIKAYTAAYRILDVDKVVIINFGYFGNDKEYFEEELEKFEENELVFFTMGRPIPEVTEDEQEENDVEEEDVVNNEEEIEEIIEEEIDGIEDAIADTEELELGVKDITSQMGMNLIGKIVLQVEENGEAWYLSPITTKAYFLGRPDDAFNIMRAQGVGIMTDNLEKIPVGLINMAGEDNDGDGLSNEFEDAIGTDKNKLDTDGDGFSDKVEVENNYDPNEGGGARMRIDAGYANSHKGKIFLQVENNGEAWYVNPADGKRYFLGRPADAFQVMRDLGLGISNENLNTILVDEATTMNENLCLSYGGEWSVSYYWEGDMEVWGQGCFCQSDNFIPSGSIQRCE